MSEIIWLLSEYDDQWVTDGQGMWIFAGSVASASFDPEATIAEVLTEGANRNIRITERIEKPFNHLGIPDQDKCWVVKAEWDSITNRWGEVSTVSQWYLLYPFKLTSIATRKGTP